MADAAEEFSALYRRHAADVLRFALSLCGDVNEAEDITSETFVRAWTSSTPIVATTMRAYLFTIARNLHRRRWKHGKRFVAISDDVADTAAAPSTRVEQRDALAAVQLRVATLPDPD